MKTINIKSAIAPYTAPKIAMAPLYPEDRHPCWYAKLTGEDDRPKAIWTVGIKEDGEDKREYSFRPAKTGDVTDGEFWGHITSSDFAIELINLFRIGGDRAVTDWVKNGCL